MCRDDLPKLKIDEQIAFAKFVLKGVDSKVESAVLARHVPINGMEESHKDELDDFLQFVSAKKEKNWRIAAALVFSFESGESHWMLIDFICKDSMLHVTVVDAANSLLHTVPTVLLLNNYLPNACIRCIGLSAQRDGASCLYFTLDNTLYLSSIEYVDDFKTTPHQDDIKNMATILAPSRIKQDHFSNPKSVLYRLGIRELSDSVLSDLAKVSFYTAFKDDYSHRIPPSLVGLLRDTQSFEYMREKAKDYYFKVKVPGMEKTIAEIIEPKLFPPSEDTCYVAPETKIYNNSIYEKAVVWLKAYEQSGILSYRFYQMPKFIGSDEESDANTCETREVSGVSCEGSFSFP